jgi:predicted F0F1-ATPase subunit
LLGNSKDKKQWHKNLPLLSLGWELALPIFGGVFIGYQLDRYFESQYIFTITLLFFGIVTGYYSLYKYIELETLRTKIIKHRNQQEN